MTKQILLKKTLLISLILIALGLFSTKVNAQEGGLKLRVSPPVLELDVEPGSSYSDYLKFTNLDDLNKVVLYPQVLSFVPLGDEGGQEFISDPDSEYSLEKWINISFDKLEIDPLERVVVPFTLNVPEDAKSGGRYAAILLGTQPSDISSGGGAVSLGAKSGSILLVKIEGEVVESLSVEEFITQNDVYNYPPVDFTIMVKNEGNVHLKPTGTVEIRNMFGKILDSLDVNSDGGNVLPDSSRKFLSTWERDALTIGRYNAVLSVQYGSDSDNYITSDITFWVLPSKEILLGVGVLVSIAGILLLVVKYYKQSVIKKAMEMSREAQLPGQNGPVA